MPHAATQISSSGHARKPAFHYPRAIPRIHIRLEWARENASPFFTFAFAVFASSPTRARRSPSESVFPVDAV